VGDRSLPGRQVFIKTNEIDGRLLEAGHVLTDQFIENVIIEVNAFTSASASHVLEEINSEIVGATYSVIPDPRIIFSDCFFCDA
jgi:hypothetical protein